ncbi:SETMR methyltransferase, partial [Acromyrmex heyeri]
MEKEQCRSVIRFLFCEEIKTKLDAVYGNSSPSMTTIRYWFNEFKYGRSSVFDRRTKVHEVAEAVGVSYGTAFNILHSRNRDETWIHYYTPKTKQQSKQWIAPKKVKTVPSTGKVMATVSWIAQGVIFIDYIGKEKTRKKSVVQSDNASTHSSIVATTKLVELRYELLPHPLYSPDLAPCDFFLFSNSSFTKDVQDIIERESRNSIKLRFIDLTRLSQCSGRYAHANNM